MTIDIMLTDKQIELLVQHSSKCKLALKQAQKPGSHLSDVCYKTEEELILARHPQSLEMFMEPIDLVDHQRQEALYLAVLHGQHRPTFDSNDVVRVAEKFLVWLKNEGSE